MKALKKVLLVMLAVIFTLSLGVVSAFAAEEEAKTFTATGNAKDGGSQLSVNFSITGLNANCQRADLVTGIGDHIRVNGVLVSEATSDDVASQVQIHQRSNMFWVYTSGYTFQKGDSVEFLAGMGFVAAGAGDAVCTADSPKLDMTLAEDYKLEMDFAGNWAVIPNDGNIKVSGLDPIVAQPGGIINYESTKLTLKMENLFSLEVMSDLQDNADIAGKFKFSGKTITEINEANDLVDKSGNSCNAITVTANGTSLDFVIDNRTEVDGKPVLSDLATFTIEPMTAPSEYKIEAYTRTYYADYDYWVATVTPTIEASGDKVLHFDTMGDWAIGGDATNKHVQFKFFEQICDENGAAGNANFYASLPRWIVTNATGRTVESVDKAVSSGAYEAALTKILVDGQDIRSIQADIEGDAAKSTAVMLHYNNNMMDLYIPADLIDLTEDHTFTIKAGMVFPTGYYVAEDMVFTYSASTQTITTPAVESVSLDKTEAEVTVGGTVSLTATLNPSNATNKMVYWTSSDEEVATVENGVVTALKAGTATITATSADGEKTATCTITVKEAASGVTLDKTTLSLEVGQEGQLTATIAPEGALASISWTSSDDSVATVVDGKVTAKKAGTATITVTTDNGKTATCTVTVTETPNQGGDEPSTGCGSAIAGSVAAVAGVLIAGAAVLLLRRKAK